jgi:transcriptional regulator with XRE-family HTH domain
MVQTSLGMRLRVLRAERGLSLRQVEAATGVAKETLSEVERGVRHPYDTTLGKLAKFYGVPLEELLEEPADPKVEVSSHREDERPKALAR